MRPSVRSGRKNHQSSNSIHVTSSRDQTGLDPSADQVGVIALVTVEHVSSRHNELGPSGEDHPCVGGPLTAAGLFCCGGVGAVYQGMPFILDDHVRWRLG